jgi:RNA polymerase sigma-70 factor (ECF subfamily)
MVGSSEPTGEVLAAPRRTPFSRSDEHQRRLETVFTSHLDFVVSILRRYGVPPADVDDATQQVFLVLGRRLPTVRPGAERGFLFRTAVHVAAHARRALARKREQLGEISEIAFEQADAEELLHLQRTRERVAHVLANMSASLRTVIVLHELEQRTMLEISTALGVPSGTVASRLRRGRALLHREIRRLERGSVTP